MAASNPAWDAVLFPRKHFDFDPFREIPDQIMATFSGIYRHFYGFSGSTRLESASVPWVTVIG